MYLPYFYGTPSTTVLEYCVLRTIINNFILCHHAGWMYYFIHKYGYRGKIRVRCTSACWEGEHNGVYEYSSSTLLGTTSYTSIPVFSTTGMSLFGSLDCLHVFANDHSGRKYSTCCLSNGAPVQYDRRISPSHPFFALLSSYSYSRLTNTVLYSTIYFEHTPNVAYSPLLPPCPI